MKMYKLYIYIYIEILSFGVAFLIQIPPLFTILSLITESNN